MQSGMGPRIRSTCRAVVGSSPAFDFFGLDGGRAAAVRGHASLRAFPADVAIGQLAVVSVVSGEQHRWRPTMDCAFDAAVAQVLGGSRPGPATPWQRAFPARAARRGRSISGGSAPPTSTTNRRGTSPGSASPRCPDRAPCSGRSPRRSGMNALRPRAVCALFRLHRHSMTAISTGCVRMLAPGMTMPASRWTPGDHMGVKVAGCRRPSGGTGHL